jgi:hypothetical protein
MTESQPSGAYTPAEDRAPVDSFDIANISATWLSDEAKNDFVDPQDAWYAQPIAGSSIEVEIVRESRSEPVTSDVAESITPSDALHLHQQNDTSDMVGDPSHIVGMKVDVEADVKSSRQHGTSLGEAVTDNGSADTVINIPLPTDVHETVNADHDYEPAHEVQDELQIAPEHVTCVCEPVNADGDDNESAHEVQEELCITSKIMMDVSEAVIVRSLDSEVADTSYTALDAKDTQHNQHMWLKLTLLPILNYYSLGLLS